jgi:peptidoglycan/xylan/chitin deacetylase (PgdA/CDA1 family)
MMKLQHAANRLIVVALLTTGLGCAAKRDLPHSATAAADRFQLDHGGIVRGPIDRRELALIFTGGDHGEGSLLILDQLRQRHVQAAFFLTGSYLAKLENREALRRMVDEGHYLGPHSHHHLLYCPWEDRGTSLVTQAEFDADLQRNIDDLRALGALPSGRPIYFVPPYEWYNEQHVRWAAQRGVVVVNFTRGTGSHRDWIPEGHAGFVDSPRIIQDILAEEARAPHGLNGHLLLLHVGALREDKVYARLGELLDELTKRGYRMVRIDEMLGAS